MTDKDTMRVMLRARKWLDRQEFTEILKVADYMGYSRGEGSLFKLNLRKAIMNDYSIEDIINLIKELNLEIINGTIKDIETAFKELTRITISWDHILGEVIVNIPWTIYREIKDLLYSTKAVFMSKNSSSINYRIKPIALHRFVNNVKEKGYYIIDEEGLIAPKYLNFDIQFQGNLRDYQKNAIEKWIENHYRGVIALPTGAGKTVVAIYGIYVTKRRTIIVTYTKEQMFQWRDMIESFTNIPSRYIGLFYGDEKRIAPITITTYQSAFRNINFLGKYYNLLIIDECHHLPADKFKLIATHTTSPYRMGLSATVVREDGRHVELFQLLGGIVYHKSAAELAMQGYLARYRVIPIKVRLTSNERKEYRELYRLYRQLAGGRGFKELLEDAKHGDDRAIKALKIHSRLRLLVANSQSKIEKAIEIAKKEFERGNKIIIFTQYVGQAKKISQELNAYLLIGELGSKERKRILSSFKEVSRGILVVTTIGDEGLDIPDANVGIIVSGTGSRRQFIQRLGRILRPKEGKEAKLYEIVIEGTQDEYYARKRKTILLNDVEHLESNPNNSVV